MGKKKKKKKAEAERTHSASMASTGGYEQLREPAGDGVYQALDVFVLDWSGLVVRSGEGGGVFTERRHQTAEGFQSGEGEGERMVKGRERNTEVCISLCVCE